jgi:hypothetical protein
MTVDTPAETGQKSRLARNLAIFLGGTALALLVVGGAAALIGRNSTPFPGAEIMPPDPIVYVEVDISDPQVDRLIETFDEATAELSGGLEELIADSGLLEGLGITEGTVLDTDVHTQVETWLAETLGTDLDELSSVVGDQMALGIYDVDVRPVMGTVDASVVVALQTENDAAAFIDRTMTFIEAERGVTFTESTHAGETIYTADDVDAGTVSMVLSDSLLVVSNDAEMLVAALDARSGESLADDADYGAVLAELPGNRVVTGYVDVDPLASLYEGLMDSPLLADTAIGERELMAGIEAMHGIGMSVVLDDDAMRLDLVVIGDAEAMDSAATQPLVASDMPNRLPADTVAYAGFGEMDLQIDWETIREELASVFAAPELGGAAGLLDWIEFNAGIDFQEDFFDLLTGEMAVGLFPANEGVIAETGEADLGFVAAAGVNDPDAMADTIEALFPLVQMMLGVGEPTEISDGLYSIGPPMMEESSIVVGVAGDYAVVASHVDHARLVEGAAADPLSGSELYQRTVGALPSDSVPFAYLDVTGLVDAFGTPDDMASALAPLQSVGASMQSRPGVSAMTVVVLIDY